MTRTIGHRLHGRIEVFAFADSISEALALEAALKQVPQGSAFQPANPSPTAISEIAGATELPAHVEALATLDADDAAPRMMDESEARSR